MNLGVVIKIKEKKTIIVTETGEFKAVKTRDGMFLGQKILFGQQDVIENSKKGIGFMYSAVIAGIAAVFVFMFTYFSMFNFGDAFAYIDVDVNPSVEFAVNRDGIVLSAEPLNEDAKKILEELTYKDELLEDVILDLIDKSRKYGFIAKDDKKNIVLISAALNSEGAKEGNNFEYKLIHNLVSDFKSLDMDIDMRFVVASKEQRRKAQENKVSMGKYMIYEMARQDGEEVTIESIVSEPLEELLSGQNFGMIEAEKVLPTETATASIESVGTPKLPTMTPTNTPVTTTATPTNTPIAPTVTPTNTPIAATATSTKIPVEATAIPTKVPVAPTATPTKIPVAPTATPTKVPVVPTVTPTKAPSGEQSVKVRFYNNNTLSESGVIYVRINVINTGNTSVNLADLKLRYYYTIDGDSEQRFNCDWSSIGAHNVIGSFVKMKSPRTGADTFVEIGFVKEAGELQAGESVELNARFSKTDNTQYDKGDDYSFSSHHYEYVDWDKITAYISGELKWGTEP